MEWRWYTLTALEAGLVVFVSAGDALLSRVHGLLALRALRVFHGFERHDCDVMFKSACAIWG